MKSNPTPILAVAVVCAVVMAFPNSQASGNDIVEVAKLMSSDGVADDYFGEAISLDGDTVVIGASGDDDNGTGSGSAYVFVRTGEEWLQQTKLVPADGDEWDRFGYPVSVYEDTIAVSAYTDDEIRAYSGSVYIFVRNGNQWSQQAKLLEPVDPANLASSAWFGYSLSLYENTLVVSVRNHLHDGIQSGAAYVFVRNVTTWNLEAKLLPSDAAMHDGFGADLSLHGDTVVIGANQDDTNGSNAGAAYIFERHAGIWTQQAKLLPADGAASDNFGWGTALHEDTAVVGAVYNDDNGFASGSAYVFVRNGTIWSQQAKLLPADNATGDYFGETMSLQDDTLVIGAGGNDDLGPYSGSTYVFTRENGAWTETDKITPSDAVADSYFGWDNSLDGHTLITGAPWGSGAGAGSAYVFSLGDPLPSLTCGGFEPPMAVYPVMVRKNRALPLKAQAFNADGYAVEDVDIAAPPVLQVLFDAGTDGDLVDVTDDALSVGLGTEGNQFVYTGDGYWQFNLKTKNYTAPGTYTVQMESGDHSEYVFEPTCETEFVVE